MRLNWGHKLVIFTVGFMLFIIGLVYMMMKQDIQLVDTDYYQKGITYQQELDKINNVKDKDYSFVYDENKQQITLHINTTDEPNGYVSFYRPADSKLDFSIPFELTAAGNLVYDVSKLAKGFWRIKVEWNIQDKQAVIHEEFFVK